MSGMEPRTTIRWIAIPLLLMLIAACTADRTEAPSPMSEAPASPTLAASSTAAPRPPSPMPLQPTPGPLASPSPACGEYNGRLERGTYRGVALAEEIPYQIYLPPCYRDMAAELPTLYLLHGYPFNESQWIDLGAIETVEGMILRGERRPFLVVLPRQPEPLFRSTDGGPGSYEQEFIEGLMPAIESTYRALAAPGGRALGGISRGAIWALEIGLRNPARIEAVGAMSPALAVNYPREAYDPYWLAEQAERLPTRIALLAGDEDWAASGTARLSEILAARGVAHLWQEIPGGHDGELWRSGMQGFLGYLTQAWVDQRQAER